MRTVNHINYPDDNGRIYCRRLNKVITLDKKGDFWDTCHSCPLFNGDYQGMGVECAWKDNTENPQEYVSDPKQELLRVSQNIDNGEFEKIK